MIWLILALLCGIALVLMLLPLTRAARSEAVNPELAVYRSQLDEVAADLSRDLISPAEAEAARTEIKRKILSIQQAPISKAAPDRDVRDFGRLLMAMIPTFALALYVTIGRPSLPGRPFEHSLPLQQEASEGQPAESGRPLDDVETMTARLAERLKKEPGDAKGWRLLGWSYANLERYNDAAAAYKQALALLPNDAAVKAQYGESLVRAAGGVVSAEAERSFNAALAIDPKEPRALFFRGLLLDQRGKPREALALWVRLLREGDPAAEWMGDVRQHATAVAIKLKLDPAREIPPTPRLTASNPEKPASGDAAAKVAQLSQKLEGDPNDYKDWISLARAYTELGNRQLARAVLSRAKDIFSGAPFVLQTIKSAEAEMLSPPQVPDAAMTRGPKPEDIASASQMSPQQRADMIDGMVAGLQQRLENNPNDLDGWLMLARSRAVLGQPDAAKDAIARARRQFVDDPEAQARIAKVVSDLSLN